MTAFNIPARLKHTNCVALLLTLSIYGSSCSNKPTIQINEQEKASNRIQINGQYPFGCPELIQFSYPKRWEGDLNNYGHLKQPMGQEFENVQSCFEQINGIPTQNQLLNIDSIQFIALGKRTLSSELFEMAQMKTEHLKYRLPDMGRFQCYYFFEKSESSQDVYGNLMLLDTKTNKAKVINIYYAIAAEQNMDYRYFYVNDSTIIIYEGAYYDDGCTIFKNFTINVDASGNVEVIELKQ